MRGGNGQNFGSGGNFFGKRVSHGVDRRGGYLVGASLALGTSCGKSSNQYSKHVI